MARWFLSGWLPTDSCERSYRPCAVMLPWAGIALACRACSCGITARAQWRGREGHANSSLILPCSVPHLCYKRVYPAWHLQVGHDVRIAESIWAQMGVLQLTSKMFERDLLGGGIYFWNTFILKIWKHLEIGFEVSSKLNTSFVEIHFNT